MEKWNIGVGVEYLQEKPPKEPSESDLNYSLVLYQVPRGAKYEHGLANFKAITEK